MQDEAMEHGLDAIADPTDRGYVESVPPSAERDAMIASLVRYRAPEALEAGDPLPTVSVLRADGLEPVALADLVHSRPLLLVFGSFT